MPGTCPKILARGQEADRDRYHRIQGSAVQQFDDLLDGIFCAYLAYYFWYWGEDGCWVVGDLETGYVTLPRCRLSNCPLHANAMLASAAPD